MSQSKRYSWEFKHEAIRLMNKLLGCIYCMIDKRVVLLLKRDHVILPKPTQLPGIVAAR